MKLKCGYTTHMNFEWDEAKAVKKFEKHDVSFKEAATVFGDPLSSTFNDPDHSIEEHRFITIGISERGRLLILAHTDREDYVRIISAREVSRREKKFYEE